MPRPKMRLIVAEVRYEAAPSSSAEWDLALSLKPEGCTWYPDARVWVRTVPGTPRWVNRHEARTLPTQSGPSRRPRKPQLPPT